MCSVRVGTEDQNSEGYSLTEQQEKLKDLCNIMIIIFMKMLEYQKKIWNTDHNFKKMLESVRD